MDAKAGAENPMGCGGYIACGTSSDKSESNLWAMAEDGQGVGRAATVKLLREDFVKMPLRMTLSLDAGCGQSTLLFGGKCEWR